MPRRCTVCSSPSRARVEAALAEGATFHSVSRESRFSELTPDSIERHWRNHVQPEVRKARWAEGMTVLSIAERLSSLAGEATVIRRSALTAGDGRLALQAVKVEGELLYKLVERLGVAPDASELAFAEAETLVRVIATIARRSPRAGEWIADQVPAEQIQLAEAIRGVAMTARQGLATADS